eukprot:CAMPEP_0118654936 /NCGR_PEP_ID=MMETSP0785-20121206/12655_1 /TAXON_ID=91992 /ORGANISM="Bolidomonas pacifica, Strain CCMP 1866" /LENGTH=379 /DNA_ID=CAMNT_0006547629 /DNA_START=130 /DNA_END=1266 /DNA_ORIENTATION=-
MFPLRLLIALTTIYVVSTFNISPTFRRPSNLYSSSSHDAPLPPPLPPPPTLTEKRVWDYNTLLKGLEGSSGDVAAVYCVSENGNKEDSWKTAHHVGVTRNLASSLHEHLKSDEIAPLCRNVRAVSFTYPQKSAMDELANSWATKANLGPSSSRPAWATADEVEESVDQEVERVRMMRASGYLVSDDDDDDGEDEDDDEDDWSAFIEQKEEEALEEAVEKKEETISSPFAEDKAVKSKSADDSLEFTEKNVDEVLNEVRPYLISDGGNVAISSIDVETRSVYLVLQGACGSCPSSTVTMKMGIERVLKENFGEIGEVKQVDDPAAGTTQLTKDVVQESVNALEPAINAMGGTVEVMDVTELGVVELKFRGSNKIKYGLEL